MQQPTLLKITPNLHGHNLSLSDALIHLSNLEANEGLEKTSSVVGARESAVLEHLLCNFTIELGRGVAEVALHIDELLHLVKLTVHLQYADLLTVVVIGAIVHLDSGVAASQLAAARDP